MRLFLDARKLRHGGIGRYIENLVLGLLSFKELELIIVCASTDEIQFLQTLSRRNDVTYLLDSSKQYSLREYFIFPLRFKSYIDSSDWYISPHYTLPFFIKSKKVVVVHDCIHLSYPDTLMHGVFGRMLIRSAINRADKVLTVSDASQIAISKEFAIPPDRIHVINNSLLPSLEKRQIANTEDDLENALEILFVGSDRPHKRLFLFLEFLVELKLSGMLFHATILSDLKEDSSLYIKENNLSSMIDVLSGINNQELFDVYQRSKFLVCTSAEEGFCLPLLEGMSSGLSVIAPKKPFSEELLSGAGWYFEPGSSADLLRVFLTVLNRPEEMDKKIKLGLDRVRNYTVASKTTEFIQYLEAA